WTDFHDKAAPDADLVLVGDAMAFWYPMRMSRWHYRTVFDVDASDGQDIITAWQGSPLPPGGWRLIDPFELERFEKTAQPLPPLPQWVQDMDDRKLEGPGDAAASDRKGARTDK